MGIGLLIIRWYIIWIVVFGCYIFVELLNRIKIMKGG